MNSADLGKALRELREAGGQQAKVVARRAAMSPSKLSKIENGVLAPGIIDVERILEALEVPEEVKQRLAEVARRATADATAWRVYYRSGLHKHQDAIGAIEAGTSLLRLFQISGVPGLLQTPEYTRGVLRRLGLTDDTLEKMIEARVRRQEVLHGNGRTFHFLISESVLRWKIIPAPMMALQLDKIVTMSRMAQVKVGVLPFSATMPTLPNSSFGLYDTRLVILEVPHAEITTREPRDIAEYVSRFERFERIAVYGEGMRTLVAGIRDEFLREQETG